MSIKNLQFLIKTGPDEGNANDSYPLLLKWLYERMISFIKVTYRTSGRYFKCFMFWIDSSRKSLVKCDCFAMRHRDNWDRLIQRLCNIGRLRVDNNINRDIHTVIHLSVSPLRVKNKWFKIHIFEQDRTESEKQIRSSILCLLIEERFWTQPKLRVKNMIHCGVIYYPSMYQSFSCFNSFLSGLKIFFRTNTL